MLPAQSQPHCLHKGTRPSLLDSSDPRTTAKVSPIPIRILPAICAGGISAGECKMVETLLLRQEDAWGQGKGNNIGSRACDVPVTSASMGTLPVCPHHSVCPDLTGKPFQEGSAHPKRKAENHRGWGHRLKNTPALPTPQVQGANSPPPPHCPPRLLILVTESSCLSQATAKMKPVTRNDFCSLFFLTCG